MGTYDYPGVFVEEDASLALAVLTGATAVPVFAIPADEDIEEPARVDSWLDFLSIHETFRAENLLHVSLRTYFDNGGGYCYICPVDKLEQWVPALDDVTLLVAAGQDIKSAAGRLSGDGSCIFSIFDGPESLTGKADDMAAYDASAHAAAYGPWLRAAWAERIPPSAAVAGAFCAVDRQRGVWKAPANIALKGGVQPVLRVSDSMQGIYNALPKALNMIRVFGGSDPLIWGARTLKSDDPRWRYVPVRRLFDSAEKDIKKAMRFAVFEPNSQPTWELARAAIDSYLHAIWRQGGLMGASAKEAYFVQVGKGTTMTADDIQQGRMIVQVGLAAVRPAEFIVLKFTQKVGAA